eukprot:2068443-Prymnesium_polylepis.1
MTPGITAFRAEQPEQQPGRRSRSGSSRRTSIMTSMSSKSWRQSKRRDVRRRRGEVDGGGGCMGQGAERHRFSLGSVDERVDEKSPGKKEPVAWRQRRVKLRVATGLR